MSSGKQTQRGTWRPLLGLVLLLGLLGVIYQFGDQLTLERAVTVEARLREQIALYPLLCWWIAFVLYVLITGTSFPGATLATLLVGWAFGLIAGVPLVSFASTAGATLAFLGTRYLFADVVRQRLGGNVERLDEAVRTDGAMALLSLRLVPLVPFFVVNLAMGLTRMRWTTYWWVSQLGMLPATIVYVQVGASLPDLKTLRDQGLQGIVTPRLFLSLVALAALPWLVRAIGRRWLVAMRGAEKSVTDSTASLASEDMTKRHP